MPINFDNIQTTGNRGYNAEAIAALNDSLRYLPIKQRAAVLGTIIEESGGDPLAKSANGTYQGLLQWGADRYRITSKDPQVELSNQLQRFRDTVNNTADKISWTHGGKGSGYNSLKEAYSDFTNPNESLDKIYRGFSFGYVRPKGGEVSYANRLKVAQQVYDRLAEEEKNKKEYGGDIDIPTAATYDQWWKATKSYLTGKKDKDLIESAYSPTLSNDPNSKYYTRVGLDYDVMKNILGGTAVNATDSFGNPLFYKSFDDLYNKLSLDNGGPGSELRITDNSQLGEYTVSVGNDERGRYVSYYDKFDWAPKGVPELFHPYEIYNRIYEDEFKKIQDELANVKYSGNNPSGKKFFKNALDNVKSYGGPLKKWDDLSIQEKSDIMAVGIRNSITNLSDIKAKYNEFAEGGDTAWQNAINKINEWYQTDPNIGERNPFYNREEDIYGTVGLPEVDITEHWTPEALRAVGARKGVEYMNKAQNKAYDVVGPILNAIVSAPMDLYPISRLLHKSQVRSTANFVDDAVRNVTPIDEWAIFDKTKFPKTDWFEYSKQEPNLIKQLIRNPEDRSEILAKRFGKEGKDYVFVTDDSGKEGIVFLPGNAKKKAVADWILHPQQTSRAKKSGFYPENIKEIRDYIDNENKVFDKTKEKIIQLNDAQIQKRLSLQQETLLDKSMRDKYSTVSIIDDPMNPYTIPRAPRNASEVADNVKIVRSSNQTSPGGSYFIKNFGTGATAYSDPWENTIIIPRHNQRKFSNHLITMPERGYDNPLETLAYEYAHEMQHQMQGNLPLLNIAKFNPATHYYEADPTLFSRIDSDNLLKPFIKKAKAKPGSWFASPLEYNADSNAYRIVDDVFNRRSLFFPLDERSAERLSGFGLNYDELEALWNMGYRYGGLLKI